MKVNSFPAFVLASAFCLMSFNCLAVDAKQIDAAKYPDDGLMRGNESELHEFSTPDRIRAERDKKNAH